MDFLKVMDYLPAINQQEDNPVDVTLWGIVSMYCII